MKILVIIVTYNAMQWVERCLNSLSSSSVEPDVYIIDNGSNDGTKDYVKNHYPKVELIESDENLGFGKANNIGLQYALDNNYDYVYLLNQDAWIFESTIEKLIEIANSHPEYGILSPFQMKSDLYQIDDHFVSGVLSWKSNKKIINDLYNNSLSEVYTVNYLMAAHWFLPISTIKKVGGFSPTFYHYGEDDNYLDRVSYYGLKVGIVPSLRVVHDRGDRITTTQKQMYISYTGYLNILSSLHQSMFKSFLSVIHLTSSDVLRYKSITPLCNFFKIIFNLSSIIKNRRISMCSVNAFL